MFRRFFRHIKEGFIGIARHFSMALSSIASVTITLLLIGLFLIITVNLNELTRELEESISFQALVSYNVTSESELSQIEKAIERIDGVADAEFISKDSEFDFYVAQYPDLSDFYELYREDNPFHDAYKISLDNTANMQAIKTEIQQINGIDSVHDGGSNTYLLVDVLNKIRIFGGALVLALVVLATYLIYNTIHITIEARETEIWIMRNVGAKNGYIRAPFIVEGIIIGIISSLVPIGAMFLSYYYLYYNFNGVVLGVFKLLPPYPFLIYLNAALLLIGVLVGIVGSWISVTRSIRITR